MRINSDGVVANLNADKLDGVDSAQIGQQMSAVVNADGSRRRSTTSVDYTGKYGDPHGHYLVNFSRNVENCAYVATTTDGNGGQIGTDKSTFGSDEVDIYTYNSSGASVNLPFHLIVAC